MNKFFGDISDIKFLTEFYEQKVAYGRNGTLGEKINEFFQDHWEILKGLDSQVVDDFFVFRGGIACKQAVYLKNDKIDWATVKILYNEENATIYLRGLQKYISAIKHLIRSELQIVTDKIPFCNIFISPAESVGLNAHFDPTDFFVFQINGDKNWDIWPTYTPSNAEMLMPEEMALFCNEVRNSQSPEISIKIVESQTLYVPRHCIHAPWTSSGKSTHVTLGLAHPELRRRGQTKM